MLGFEMLLKSMGVNLDEVKATGIEYMDKALTEFRQLNNTLGEINSRLERLEKAAGLEVTPASTLPLLSIMKEEKDNG